MFALYKGDDEDGTLQWLEHSIPFTGEVECSGCTFDMVPNLEASVINQSVEVKPDSDGEERIFVTDIVLELDIRLYRKKTMKYLWMSILRFVSASQNAKMKFWKVFW